MNLSANRLAASPRPAASGNVNPARRHFPRLWRCLHSGGPSTAAMLMDILAVKSPSPTTESSRQFVRLSAFPMPSVAMRHVVASTPVLIRLSRELGSHYGEACQR